MESLKKAADAAELEITSFFYSTHSSSLPKRGAYITHNAMQTVWRFGRAVLVAAT